MNKYLGWKPAFISYTINLNQDAQNGKLEPVAGREKEINQVIDILSRRTKNNPLIIGESGIGKTAIVEGLAQKIVAGKVPQSMLNKEILQLDLSLLIAGARQKGEFEQRLRDVITSVLGTHNAILFIEDIHLFLGSNNKTAEIFKKYMDHGQLPLIGVTTLSQYNEYFDKNKSFERNFQTVRVEEPTEDESFVMLQAQRPKYEKFHNVIIPDETIKQAITLTKRYIPQRFFPDKTLDLLDEAAADVKMQIEKGQRGNKKLKKSDIEKILSEWIGIRITKLTEDESSKLLMLEKLIHKKFAGQQTAVTKVSEAVRRGRIGLGAYKRPVASFVFHGASGVGKTELVKVLAEILFNREDALLQLDMSEYMEKQDIAKLIGAPPGYVGYEAGGVLTEAISRRPSMIILMDNMEKAHPDIANILLQILEEGYLTDNHGNKVSFKNTIVIGTTSLGHELIQEKITAMHSEDKNVDALLEKLEPDMKNELLKFFSPELLNRFDGIVSFKPLNIDDMGEISRLQVGETAALLKKQDFVLQITQNAIVQLAKAGYNPKEGARPLRRVISELIVNPVAVAIISQKFMPGDTILVEFIFDKGFAISTSAKQILEYTKIKLPNIRDIAAYDTSLLSKEQAQMNEADNISELLKKLANIETVTDSDEKAGLEELKKQLLAEKEKGNPVADVILAAVQSLSQKENAGIPLPSVNSIQIVSDEEYDEVKKIWMENYLDLEATGNSIEAQTEWIKKEGETSSNMVKLFTSNTTQDKEQAMQDIIHILPFLLIGGFTQEEIIAYLQAKNEAAKLALDTLQDEEETILTIQKPKPKQPEKPLAAQLEVPATPA